ncbi:unnamed protein product, partial [Ilex paraguariensis]
TVASSVSRRWGIKRSGAIVDGPADEDALGASKLAPRVLARFPLLIAFLFFLLVLPMAPSSGGVIFSKA